VKRNEKRNESLNVEGNVNGNVNASVIVNVNVSVNVSAIEVEIATKIEIRREGDSTPATELIYCLVNSPRGRGVRSTFLTRKAMAVKGNANVNANANATGISPWKGADHQAGLLTRQVLISLA